MKKHIIPKNPWALHAAGRGPGFLRVGQDVSTRSFETRKNIYIYITHIHAAGVTKGCLLEVRGAHPLTIRTKRHPFVRPGSRSHALLTLPGALMHSWIPSLRGCTATSQCHRRSAATLLSCSSGMAQEVKPIILVT